MAEKESRRGRPALGEQKKHFVKFSVAMPQELYDRLSKFCEDDERSRGWAICKAVDPWLKERGY